MKIINVKKLSAKQLEKEKENLRLHIELCKITHDEMSAFSSSGNYHRVVKELSKRSSKSFKRRYKNRK